MKPFLIKIISLITLIIIACETVSPDIAAAAGNDYGAFLSISDDDMDKLEGYSFVSIDVNYFSKKNITSLHKAGTEVFAYLNVGSLEDFRDYYDDYVHLTFMDYENWEEERWIDISSEAWQDFVINTLAVSFKKKGADGIYMDNVDVYTIAKEYYGEDNEKIIEYYNSLKKIIQGVSALGLKVMINGGSEFLLEAIESKDEVLDSIYGYHQEEVFSSIKDYDKNIFKKQSKSNSSYYKSVIKQADEAGLQIFLLEYTTSRKLIKKIKKYCKKRGYSYFCAKSTELD